MIDLAMALADPDYAPPAAVAPASPEKVAAPPRPLAPLRIADDSGKVWFDDGRGEANLRAWVAHRNRTLRQVTAPATPPAGPLFVSPSCPTGTCPRR